MQALVWLKKVKKGRAIHSIGQAGGSAQDTCPRREPGSNELGLWMMSYLEE